MTILQTFLTGRISPFSYYSLPIFFEAFQSLIKKLSINANWVPRIISKSIDSILMGIQICILICMGSFSIVWENDLIKMNFWEFIFEKHIIIKLISSSKVGFCVLLTPSSPWCVTLPIVSSMIEVASITQKLRKVHLFTLDRILGRFYKHLMTGGVLCVVVTLLSLVCHIHHSIIDDRSSRHKTIIKEGSFIYAWRKGVWIHLLITTAFSNSEGKKVVGFIQKLGRDQWVRGFGL